MSDSVSVLQTQIERIVLRQGAVSYAEFVHLAGWYCCKAIIVRGTEYIEVCGGTLKPEQAAVVAVCIQMAIDWLAEERSRSVSYCGTNAVQAEKGDAK